jgi:hypothetical protein
LLPFLRAAAKQNDQTLAILAKVDSVAGPKSILYSKTPDPTPLTFEKLPTDSRVMATATFAAA